MIDKKTAIWLALGVLAVVALIVVIVVATAVIHKGGSCDGGPFRDVVGTNGSTIYFAMEDKIVSLKNEMHIINPESDDKLGEWFEKSKVQTGRTFRMRVVEADGSERVTVTVREKAFTILPKFQLDRCDGTGSSYDVEGKFSFGSEEYKIYKDGVKIAESSKGTVFSIKPDIEINDLDGNSVAAAGRGWQFVHKDKWGIEIINPKLVPPFVVSFIAYRTTLMEQEDKRAAFELQQKLQNEAAAGGKYAGALRTAAVLIHTEIKRAEKPDYKFNPTAAAQQIEKIGQVVAA